MRQKQSFSSSASLHFRENQKLTRGKPPFPNDIIFIKQIEREIKPNRRFPFVQLKSLVEEERKHIQLQNSLAAAGKQFTPKKKTESEGLTLKCHICCQFFGLKLLLNYHLRHDHFNCPLCPDSYGTKKELDLHLGSLHPDDYELVINQTEIFTIEKNIQCHHCPQKFTCESKLSRHINFESNKPKFICDVCGSKFAEEKYLEKHKSEQKCAQVMEQKFKCDHCQDSMTSHKNLQTHLDISHGIKKVKKKIRKDLICLFCGYSAPNAFQLEQHTRTHTGRKKSFECEDCNLEFAVKGALTAHLGLFCPYVKKNQNFEGQMSPESPVDPISSWVKSVTNSSDPLATSESYFSFGGNPITVLKMEPL